MWWLVGAKVRGGLGWLNLELVEVYVGVLVVCSYKLAWVSRG